jgi:hypothetical protein
LVEIAQRRTYYCGSKTHDFPKTQAKRMSDWTQLTIAGFRHLSNAEYEQAAFCWLRAVDFFADSRDDDPRSATTHNNAGVAYGFLGRDSHVQAEFDIAERKWAHTLTTIASLDVPITSGSSSFHFHLVSASPDAFADVHRRKYDARCRTSVAIAQFNTLIADAKRVPTENIRAQAQKLESLTTDTYGQNSPESRLLSAISKKSGSAASSLYRDKIARVERKLGQRPNRDNDRCFNIEIAAELMAIYPTRDLLKIVSDGIEASSFSISTEG